MAHITLCYLINKGAELHQCNDDLQKQIEVVVQILVEACFRPCWPTALVGLGPTEAGSRKEFGQVRARVEDAGAELANMSWLFRWEIRLEHKDLGALPR